MTDRRDRLGLIAARKYVNACLAELGVAGVEVEPGEATQIERAVYGADVDVASRKIFLRDGAT
ncbi:MAG TPA: hypothetical protein VGU71_14145 [Candidatus Dormibacteraeota bacterium]|nr:hypothetical protein [Candidatus Dormibacteraeota bacterium]